MESSDFLEVVELVKHFGGIKAVDGITFRVGRGEVFGFLGPNGAGKSTTMKMITGFITPTSGSIKVLGYDIAEAPLEVKSRIGYLPESAALYPDMQVLPFLRFINEVRKIEGEEAIERVIKQCSLESVLEQRIETLSKGFKRRVALAQAIIHDPDILVMDEPTDGLDPNQKAEVRRLIREMSKEKIIILSTHILEEVEALCTRAAIISQGRIRFDGSPDDLRELSRVHNAVAVKLHKPLGRDEIDKLKALEQVADADVSEKEVIVYPEGKKNISHEIVLFANSQGWDIDEVSHMTGNLNEVFRNITEGGKA